MSAKRVAARWCGLVAILACLALRPPGAPDATHAAEEPRTALAGHVPTALSRATYLGPVDPDETLTLTVALRPRTERLRSDAASATRSRPASTSIQSVAGTYGRSDAEVAGLADFFAGYGLSSGSPRPDHLSLQVGGTAGAVERALGVSLGYYRDPGGQRFYAAAADPRLPSRLAPMVRSIFGLDDYPTGHALHTPLERATAAPPPSPGRTVAVTAPPPPFRPRDVVGAYDLAPLYARGETGAGRTIGVLGCWAYDPSDVRAFAASYGLPAPSIATVLVDGGGNGPDAETTLDLEWANAVAPGAALRVYSFPNAGTGCPFGGFYDAVATAVNENAADVLSISLGACEADYGGFLASIEDELAVAALQGQSVVAASGDLGAYCADDGGSLTLGLSYPASSAYATAVGGTTLTVEEGGSGATYESEAAWGSWSGCGGQPCGSGGGVSASVPAPAWQSGVIGAGGTRAVPDVAYDADPLTGYYLAYHGLLYVVGGTSAGAPQWAGLVAILDQAGRQRFGLLNPLLYDATSRDSVVAAAYHDVTTGTNLVYPASRGWDEATGWGSPDATRLIDALLAALPSAPSLPVSTSPRAFLPRVP